MKMRRFFAAVLELGGIAAVAVAGFLIVATLGWFVVGVGLIVFGIAIERGGS